MVSLKPQKISETAWYYESKWHIEVHVQPSAVHRSFRISKKQLQRSLRRMGQPMSDSRGGGSDAKD